VTIPRHTEAEQAIAVFQRVIEGRADEIVEAWSSAVRRDHQVPSADVVPEPLLRDAVPGLLRELLRAIGDEESRIRGERIVWAREHGQSRARQQFEARELVREYQILRQHLLGEIRENFPCFEHICSEAVLMLCQRVDLELDSALQETVEAFLEERTAELRSLADLDGLTGLFNHRAFQARLSEELERAERYPEPVTIALLDLNAFKAVNDAWGHPFGDRVLHRCAQQFRVGVRTNDIVCRYGGDEFAIIFPHTSARQASRLVARLQDRLEKLGESGEAPAGLGFSVGLASCPEDGCHPTPLIDMADRRLREVKRSGPR
jgi:diguanylate cyclase (GGDEF)-like protein